jgi:hypothetical protein
MSDDPEFESILNQAKLHSAGCEGSKNVWSAAEVENTVWWYGRRLGGDLTAKERSGPRC